MCQKSPYFLLVPEPEDWEKAYLDGTDYPALFRALSDETVFRAFVRLSRHKPSKFTTAWLAKTLEISPEKAEEVLGESGMTQTSPYNFPAFGNTPHRLSMGVFSCLNRMKRDF